MPDVPPVVRSAKIGTVVYLLRWVWHGQRRWEAEIAWVEWDGKTWVANRATVPASDVTRLQGQNYKSVPKWKIAEVLREQRTP